VTAFPSPFPKKGGFPICTSSIIQKEEKRWSLFFFLFFFSHSVGVKLFLFLCSRFELQKNKERESKKFISKGMRFEKKREFSLFAKGKTHSAL